MDGAIGYVLGDEGCVVGKGADGVVGDGKIAGNEVELGVWRRSLLDNQIKKSTSSRNPSSDLTHINRRKSV